MCLTNQDKQNHKKLEHFTLSIEVLLTYVELEWTYAIIDENVLQYFFISAFKYINSIKTTQLIDQFQKNI